MASEQYMSMIFECDQCGKVADGVAPGPSSAPAGWVSVTPSITPAGDWFCSWECLGSWCVVRAKDRDERLALFKARSAIKKAGKAAT